MTFVSKSQSPFLVLFSVFLSQILNILGKVKLEDSNVEFQCFYPVVYMLDKYKISCHISFCRSQI